MPKRKADVLTADTKSNPTTAQRPTRSSGPAPLPTTRSPAKPVIKKVYGGKRVTTRTIIVPDTDEEAEEEEEQEVAVKTKAPAKRGQIRAAVDADLASTSSKGHTRKPARGRQEAQATPVVERKSRQPSKRRKVTPPEDVDEVPIPPIRTRNSKSTASTNPTTPVRKGRQHKAKVPPLPAPDPPVEDEDDDEPLSPLKGRGTPIATRASTTIKRPRSPSPIQSPKKRQPPAKKGSSLFVQPRGDEGTHWGPEEGEQPGPSKRANVVVEPRTPRRKRGAPAAPDGDQEAADEDKTINLPSSPIKQPTTPSTRHRMGGRGGAQSVPTSPTKSTHTAPLPDYLVPFLNAQKRAVLRGLCNPPPAVPSENDGDGEPAGKGKEKAKAREGGPEGEVDDDDNGPAYEQFKALLEGTTSRNEGNSCLLLGPRGSGKTRLVERCLEELCKTSESEAKPKPIIIRLSGWVQYNDRLALRQIAVQLADQTGNSYLAHFGEGENERVEGPATTTDEEENPFLDDDKENANADTNISLPPSSHLPALISLLPTLKRPTIVLIDAFDLFALHPRQALLYCLLDTAQACQSTQGNKGLAVVGLTSRVDVVQLLEKRVKSRFSGRILRVGNVKREEGWMRIARRCLCVEPDFGGRRRVLRKEQEEDERNVEEEWKEVWMDGVDKFLDDPTTCRLIHESHTLLRSMPLLFHLLLRTIPSLTPSHPFPTPSLLRHATLVQRTRTPFTLLHEQQTYPGLCLLIAGWQSEVKGHAVFTFEMLYEAFRVQVRASMAAPIVLNGTSIGMVKCSRAVMLSAFELLVSSRIFVATATPSLTTPKEFVKYRSVVGRDVLKNAIEKTGQVSLRKWWSKS